MKNTVEIPVVVEKISIDGIKITKHDFIKKQLQSEKMFAAKTMDDVVQEIKSVKERLSDLEIFKTIDVVLDKAQNPKHLDDESAKLHVIFNVEEKKPRKIDVKAMCGLDNSVGLNLEIIQENIFGRAGKLDVNYQNNIKAIGGRSFSFIKPLEGIPRIKMAFGGWDNNFDHWWSRFIESSTGGFGEILMKTKLGHHQCRFETMWREILANDKAPLEVHLENGHNMKSSLKHTFTRDTRDDKVYPESGYKVALSQEMFTDLTRLGRDSSSPLSNLNLKLEAELQKSFSIRQFVIENTFGCGLIKSMTKDETKVPIPDRYFIGGPLTMRGFELRSMAPLSTDGCPLGSNTYFQHGLHMYSPLPYLNKEGYAGLFRIHGFINSATTSPFSIDNSQNLLGSGDVHGRGINSAQQVVHQYLSTFRCTAGLGVIFKLANTFRIEINYCVPLRVNPADRVVGGFQFGIGILYA